MAADMDKLRRRMHDKLAKGAADAGRLVEGGWLILASQAAAGKFNGPELNNPVAWGRFCFFAGAQHLMAAIMSSLDPEAEPTDADLRRMALLQSELDAWAAEVAGRFGLDPNTWQPKGPLNG